jgi:hypothetical protein
MEARRGDEGKQVAGARAVVVAADKQPCLSVMQSSP